MSRRPLPKLILSNDEDLRNDDLRNDDLRNENLRNSAAAADEEVAFSPPAWRRAIEAKPQSAIAPVPVSPVPAPAASPATPRALKRRSLARRIVERYKMYAAMGGLFPLPIVSVAGVTAINMRMVKALSDLYGLPFRRERTRSTIIGLMGGAVPTGFAAATTSTLALVVPGAGFVGLAVSSLTAAAFTRGIGLVFIEQFESEPPPGPNGEAGQG